MCLGVLTMERVGRGEGGGSSPDTMGELDASPFAEQPIKEGGRVPREGGADAGRERSVHEPLDEDVLQGLRAGGHAGEQGLQRLVAPTGRFRPIPGLYGWALNFAVCLVGLAAQAPFSHGVFYTTCGMRYSMPRQFLQTFSSARIRRLTVGQQECGSYTHIWTCSPFDSRKRNTGTCSVPDMCVVWR